MRQWQAYVRTANGTGADEYSHELGYFVRGEDEEAPMVNVTAATCLAECTRRAAECSGVCFEADEQSHTSHP